MNSNAGTMFNLVHKTVVRFLLRVKKPLLPALRHRDDEASDSCPAWEWFHEPRFHGWSFGRRYRLNGVWQFGQM